MEQSFELEESELAWAGIAGALRVGFLHSATIEGINSIHSDPMVRVGHYIARYTETTCWLLHDTRSENYEGVIIEGTSLSPEEVKRMLADKMVDDTVRIATAKPQHAYV